MMSAVTLSAMIAAGVGALVGSALLRHVGHARGLVAGARRIPALGGIAVMAAWWGSALVFADLPSSVIVGLLLSTAVIAAVGIWDIRRALSPAPQLVAQFAAAAIVVGIGGLSVRYVTNPFGGLLRFDQWDIAGYAFPAILLTLLWIMALMNVMNFLDGVDGLAAGVGAVACITIGFVSLLPQVGEPTTALLAFAAAAALVGFLFWNLPPAALYLGTAGAWFVGFLLAVLSVRGASKVATIAVVGAVPLLDAATVIIGRIRRGQSPFRGDLTHLHHRLERRGMSARSILFLYLFCSSLLGAGAVLLQTHVKVLVFLLVACVFVLAIAFGTRVVRPRGSSIH